MKRLNILEIFAEKREGTDKPVFNWEYFGNFNAYALLGLLDVIKDELVTMINEESLENAED